MNRFKQENEEDYLRKTLKEGLPIYAALPYYIEKTGTFLEEKMPMDDSNYIESRFDLNYRTVMSQEGIYAIKRDKVTIATAPILSLEESILSVKTLKNGNDPNIPKNWDTLISGIVFKELSFVSTNERYSFNNDKDLNNNINKMVHSLKNPGVEQDAYIEWNFGRVITRKEEWMAERLQKRDDPNFAYDLCCKIADKEPELITRERWNDLQMWQTPYRDLARFATSANAEKFEKAIERRTTLWDLVKDERINYAKNNGVRMMQRSRLSEEYKEKVEPYMREGLISKQAMLRLGDGDSYELMNTIKNLDKLHTKKELSR